MDKYAFVGTANEPGTSRLMASATLKTAILGATGYSGLELVRILAHHPRVERPLLLRRSEMRDSASLADVLPQVYPDSHLPLEPFSWEKLHEHKTELLFLATPHSLSRELVPEAISRKLRVIDLSGAWRLKESEHLAVYGFHDADPQRAGELTSRAVYGLPELNASRISGATLVANPGCYATSVILGLAPFVSAGVIDRERGIISDSKSGVSGAGKEPTARTHFVSVADNLSAYSVFNHRHTGEMLEQLGLESQQLIFTPHLLPIPRGILSTIYVYLNRAMTAVQLETCFRGFYQGRHWIRVFPASTLPQIQYSLHTNYCDIGFSLAGDGRRLIIVSCLDNLMKGAAGQAVQNMNLMYEWPEQEGLE